MVYSVTCWYDVLVWGKWDYFGQWSTIVRYVRVCLTDGIAYCTITSMSWLHIIPCAYAQQREQSIHLISDSSPICDEVVWCFPQSSICVSTVSQHVKTNFDYFQMISCWIIIQHFHFKLLELNLNVHLCFNYIVLI